MVPRERAARFIESQLSGWGEVTWRDKPHTSHYGAQELRDLLDFMYGGKPASPREDLNSNINVMSGSERKQ